MKQRIGLLTILPILLLATMPTLLGPGTVELVYADPDPIIMVSPPTVEAKINGSIVQVNVTLNNLVADQMVIGLDFKLQFNETLLAFVNVTEGPLLPYFASQQPGCLGTWFLGELVDDGIFGPHVLVGNLLYPNSTGYWNPPFPEGSGTVATINFRAIYQERGLEKPPLTCELALVESHIVGLDVSQEPLYVSHTLQNGLYKMWPTHICDCNYDGKVDLKDWTIVATAFGETSGRPRYCQNADIDGNCIIDLRDLFKVRKAYGWNA